MRNTSPDSHETASLSEPALAKDWDRPEEDAAWSYHSNGSVILVPFPFSDLRQSKMRPAVVLAPAERGDWILCQITSNPYGDARAIELTNADFVTGGLRIVSYARPTKLFTAHESLLVKEAGKLHAATHRKICDAVIAIIR